MDAITAVMTRRSIRRYKPDPVPEEMVETLMKCAMLAPSARNTRPWHFIVADDRKVINELHAIHKFSNMLTEAPLCIAVIGDRSRECLPDYHLEDCGAATENILVAARGLGLGTCWMGVDPHHPGVEPLADYFGLPNHLRVFGLIAVGFPAEEKEIPEDRYDFSLVHRNKW